MAHRRRRSIVGKPENDQSEKDHDEKNRYGCLERDGQFREPGLRRGGTRFAGVGGLCRWKLIVAHRFFGQYTPKNPYPQGNEEL
jgi:hypothetical protein